MQISTELFSKGHGLPGINNLNSSSAGLVAAFSSMPITF